MANDDWICVWVIENGPNWVPIEGGAFITRYLARRELREWKLDGDQGLYRIVKYVRAK